jgi:release factor glutamine methyltransferase
MTFKNALTHGAEQLHHLPTARRDAELLLLRATGKDRTFLLAHSDAELPPAQYSLYEQWLVRRAQHEPIQYITGEQEFYGLVLRVTPDVLIPRQETEHLVEALLDRVPHNTPLRIADIGTGSGAIAIALAHALPSARITAIDNSAAALAIAQHNAEDHNVAHQIRFLNSDLLSAVTNEKFHAIVSNPPYVSEFEILEQQVQNYEPHAALFAGPSGLEIYQRLIPQARQALEPRGWLLVEIGHSQRNALAALLSDWREVNFVNDLQQIPRVVVARKS